MMRAKCVRVLTPREGAGRNVNRIGTLRWCRTVARRWRQHGLIVHPALGELLLMLALAVWLLWASGID